MNRKLTWAVRILPVTVLTLLMLWLVPAQADSLGDLGTQVWENAEINGFIEARTGRRTKNDAQEKGASVMDARLQLEFFTYTDKVDLKFKADTWGDGITKQLEYDTREAWIFTRALGETDLKIGRQVLTWGTGDLVFLNDLFPKDWPSFFMGRDSEYLKAPSDAAKLSLFSDLAGLDLVYTPKFDPDRYITGEYISHWNGNVGKITGRNEMVETDVPDRWFRDHEMALRIFTTIQNYEVAMYGYSGFWKTPSGSDDSGRSTFPKLNVYGASLRGPVGAGIGNLEFAWYDSRQDRGGSDPLKNNSQLRYLAGYTRDLARDLNAGLQYYVEQILHHDAYETGLTTEPARDQFRHVITVQFTQLLLHQTLTLAFSSYLSPSDRDAYVKPSLTYQYTDNLVLEAGANIFFGKEIHTFFGQFKNNTNVYGAIRYEF